VRYASSNNELPSLTRRYLPYWSNQHLQQVPSWLKGTRKRQSLDQLKTYPLFNPFAIKKKAQGFYELLKNKEFKALQKLYHSLIRVIYVDNDKVEVILNLHRLMDVLTPMLLTVQEKRDNVAHKYKSSRVRFDINCLKIAV